MSQPQKSSKAKQQRDLQGFFDGFLPAIIKKQREGPNSTPQRSTEHCGEVEGEALDVGWAWTDLKLTKYKLILIGILLATPRNPEINTYQPIIPQKNLL